MNQTRTLEEVNREIADLEKQLTEVKGTKTEIYTRIVGYYRSVANWNKGKREEYNYRKLFSEPSDMIKHGSRQPEFAIKDMTAEHAVDDDSAAPGNTDAVSSYSFYYRQACPNCPPVNNFIGGLSIPGEALDVDTPEGMDKAIQHQVLASPTVIFFDVQGHEIFRAHNMETLEEAFSEAEAGVH